MPILMMCYGECSINLSLEGSTVHACIGLGARLRPLDQIGHINPNQSVFGGGQIVLCNQLEALYV